MLKASASEAAGRQPDYTLEDYLNGTPAIRRRIIDASAALFRRRGFSFVTMKDIASALDLSKAGLYHHCPSKDEILADIVRICAELLRGQMARAKALDGSAVERLHSFVVTRMETIARYQDLFAIIWQERPFIRTEVFGDIVEITKTYRSDLRDLIDRAKRAGAIREEVDTHLLMLAVDGMTGWAYIWYRDNGANDPTTIGEAFWSFVSQGVLGVEIKGELAAAPEKRRTARGTRTS